MKNRLKTLETIKNCLNVASARIEYSLNELTFLDSDNNSLDDMYSNLSLINESIIKEELIIDNIIEREKNEVNKDKIVKVYLKEILKEKNVTMRELERETGITVNAISMLANQKTSGIQYHTLLKIALYLGVEIGDIIKIQ